MVHFFFLLPLNLKLKHATQLTLTLGLQQGIAELGIVLLSLQLSKKLHLKTWPPVPLHVHMGTGRTEEDIRGGDDRYRNMVTFAVKDAQKYNYYCWYQWWAHALTKSTCSLFYQLPHFNV